jgi:hypothetical protein
VVDEYPVYAAPRIYAPPVTPVRFGVTDGAIDVTSTGVGKSLICRGVGETTPLPRAAAPAVVFEVDDGPNYCDPVLFLRFLMQSKEKI